LAADARFCAHCGAPAGGPGARLQSPAPGLPSAGISTPWRIVGGLAVVAAAAVIWAVSRGGSANPAVGAVPTATAPDISNLSPREQFSRLADRVETAMENGDTTTVVRFFPMVEQAFTNLSMGDRDADARFHIALLRSRVGHFPAGLAQVDSIAASAPSHLFVYYLKAIIADFQNDTVTAKRARQDFRKHFDKEVATGRPEYVAHRQMLDQFLATIPAK
jgi:hypothetical protein